MCIKNTSNNKSQKKQQGAEIIEFAILVPILLLFFAAFLEFGVGFSDKAVIADASRTAARDFIRGNTNPWCAVNSVLNSSVSWGTGKHYICKPDLCPGDPDLEYETCECDINSSSGTTNPGDEITANINCSFQFRLLGPMMDLVNILSDDFNPSINLSGTTKMRMLPN